MRRSHGLSVHQRLAAPSRPTEISHTFLPDTQRFAPQPPSRQLEHRGKGTKGRSRGTFGPNNLAKVLKCSSVTCAGQSAAEQPWHMQPSSLTTATAMGSVLLAGETPLHCQYSAIGDHRDVLTQGQAELDFSSKKPSTQDCQRTWIDWTLLYQGLLIQSENGHMLQRIGCRLPCPGQALA